MLTEMKRLEEDEFVYQLTNEETMALHPAVHEPMPPRLLCVLEIAGEIKWNTVCLSDFIRKREFRAMKFLTFISTISLSTQLYQRPKSHQVKLLHHFIR